MTASAITTIDTTKSSLFLKKLQCKILQENLDLIILSQAKTPTCGYDVLKHLKQKYGFLVSSGTVYSLIANLEKADLINSSWFGRKRVYQITVKGATFLTAVASNQALLTNLFALVLKETTQ